MSTPLTARLLVLGGARSGKSTFAEQQAGLDTPVDYLATSEVRADDPEWVERVRLHRERRPSYWNTIETLDLAAELRNDTDTPLLIDCLTVWLTCQMDAAGIWTNEPGCDETLKSAVDHTVDAFAKATRPLVAVSNEVGQGLVPADPGSRRFRDEMGILNMRVAQAVDEVWFCTAGIPVKIK
ncbi:bifunctional adenosylcobinamide kinase/adenosylcobinamide-phosphate guanylyltransferase [Propionimicrobium sp. PCR01-08-3]|uniref:bifunctional adenosylcobinamide kinase/adenosylcobinamide-phosphate guanylyltransferase n=1 Tax=Propionimicrobium sp. PCR01-08-3 TaxID=3052086 RepID=UPI00255CCE3C|nr:bifunctional adenosylcobinamide kinase/adenosylcobinamide-phosphate guanylyltransferase [Propionimicrobium sp. PCR01-08-3]WIY81749.1 bifunctional adenosylcobinamide kinase/adenosylcobinamide-phosphate guanylyltransferase [Propionimicrobium sp. PCR01-08-3]